jgi:hypothetical protein
VRIVVATALLFQMNLSSAVNAHGALNQPPPIRLKRGISMVGWFTWSHADSTGATFGPDPFPEIGKVTVAEQAQLRQMGIDFVRLPVEPGPFLAADAEQRQRLMARVGAVIAQLQQAGFSVIWDYHPRPARFAYSYPDIFANGGRHVADYQALLTETARFLAQFPANRTALELINEPPLGCKIGAGQYTSLITAAYRAARQGDAQLPLMLEGGCFASLDTLDSIDLTALQNDPAVLFTFHFYEPWAFVTQGDTGNNAVFMRNLGNLHFPPQGSPEQPLATLRANLNAPQLVPLTTPLTDDQKQQAIATGTATVQRYLASGNDDAWIASRFDVVSHWATSQGINPGRIALGEFSVVRGGMSRGAPDVDRARWLRDVRTAAEARGLPWAYWSYLDPKNGMSLIIMPERTLDPVAVEALGLKR